MLVSLLSELFVAVAEQLLYDNTPRHTRSIYELYQYYESRIARIQAEEAGEKEVVAAMRTILSPSCSAWDRQHAEKFLKI